MIKTIEDWNSSADGDLMAELAVKAGVDLKTITRVKVEQAKLVEHLMTDKRSINALRVAERFADGGATEEELARVAIDADAVAYASWADATTYAYAAAYAASYAANAANADAAVYAADAVAYAAYDTKLGEGEGVYNKTLKQCADICRQYINPAVIEEYLETVK